MRIGTLCYAHSRGLGYLAKGFYDHGIVTDVLVVQHPNIPEITDWYPGARRVPLQSFNRRESSRTTMHHVYEFAKQMDAMLFFETPFDWSLMRFCKNNNIPTYLIPMYECTPESHAAPHKYLCPSLLDVQYFGHHNHEFIPLPVEYPWRLRQRATRYQHNGGYLGLRGREGTTTLIEAMQYVKSPLNLTIRVQEHVEGKYQEMMAKDPRIEYLHGTFPYEELYRDNDVVVQPQKFNGCSLPLQEAFASGMLVISTDRFPMNTWLPSEPLIPVNRYNEGVRVGRPYLPIQEAVVDPHDIAEVMDSWFEKDITQFSELGRLYAEDHSWAALKPRFLQAMSD